MEKREISSVEFLIEKIKQKISNDDILGNILNGEILTIRDGCEDWEIECGRNIVDIYKKLSKLVEKIR
ncbi:hypothetical protein [Thermoanaerobacterium thermosaccharolyticum]|jgi:hypothetical protein|uniref:NADP oxidoreductase n=1 Tax=Thermoanaerobacterium thermosaccharolyticum TaxID=1517 RepID=A0A231VDL0_THETR|nr:hypothetical protein [Thermoanaerobacterium thermosaccharolyticum]TCW41992.1 hypothetical protein EDC21_103158 [Thermohydrogenium kirishiense]AST56344.1 NADP oxidoreductase [Thermoanaerobacterium thermosaccharolyticum]KAA5806726.1 hypothetical protein F1655_07770 [Thermoanaerobacterium thermosaccharolyticum]OXT06111.1 hypothetical protein CE561_11470 [Thermoanaerobacterium thermosaccharolyticum]PHO08375.1 hypothetical protein BFT35_00255 [Thermoanaerobacterium thermosaccharolyticum]